MAIEVGEFSRVGRVSVVSVEEVRVASHVSWYWKLKIVFGVAGG
jgi:hypothetical protein